VEQVFPGLPGLAEAGEEAGDPGAAPAGVASGVVEAAFERDAGGLPEVGCALRVEGLSGVEPDQV